jgi:hypothetical protein
MALTPREKSLLKAIARTVKEHVAVRDAQIEALQTRVRELEMRVTPTERRLRVVVEPRFGAERPNTATTSDPS